MRKPKLADFARRLVRAIAPGRQRRCTAGVGAAGFKLRAPRAPQAVRREVANA